MGMHSVPPPAPPQERPPFMQLVGAKERFPGLEELIASAFAQDTLRSVGERLGSPEAITARAMTPEQFAETGLPRSTLAFVRPADPSIMNFVRGSGSGLRESTQHELGHTTSNLWNAISERFATRVGAMIEAMAEASAWDTASEDEVVSRAQNIFKERWNLSYGPVLGFDERPPEEIGMSDIFKKISGATIYRDHPVNRKR